MPKKKKEETKEVTVLAKKPEEDNQGPLPEAYDLDVFAEKVKWDKRVKDLADQAFETIPITKENRLRVRLYKIAGVQNDVIAKCLGVSYNYFMQRFKTDIRCGEADFRALVTSQLVQKIKDGEERSIIYYLEKRGRWANMVIEENNEIIPDKTKEEIEAELKEHGVDPSTIRI